MVVLPEPGTPSSRYSRWGVYPPSRILSRPSMLLLTVADFSAPCCMGSPLAEYAERCGSTRGSGVKAAGTALPMRPMAHTDVPGWLLCSAAMSAASPNQPPARSLRRLALLLGGLAMFGP